jgi:two-component system LytT family response regulator
MEFIQRLRLSITVIFAACSIQPGLKDMLACEHQIDFNTSFWYAHEGTVYYRVALKDILYVSSDHVYLSVYTDGRKFLLRSTMTAFLDRLLPAPFIRVHRSYAINGARVEQVENDAVVVAGKRIPTSKAGREQLMAILLIGN